MARSRVVFRVDTSILAETPSLQDSQMENNFLVGARMDMSCIYQTTLYLIEHLLSLRSITV
jgi:hypothetical protein